MSIVEPFLQKIKTNLFTKNKHQEELINLIKREHKELKEIILKQNRSIAGIQYRLRKKDVKPWIKKTTPETD